MCVMRIAELVLLTCWPPAPEARNVSMRRSAGFRTISMVSSTSGYTNTLAHEAMDAGLGAQVPVGVIAGHLEGGALDARHLARGILEQVDLPAPALAVA